MSAFPDASRWAIVKVTSVARGFFFFNSGLRCLCPTYTGGTNAGGYEERRGAPNTPRASNRRRGEMGKRESSENSILRVLEGRGAK